MNNLKVSFHLHTKEDPIDVVAHTEKELIDRAAELGYDALSITCHNVVIFNEALKDYASKKGILLIPGIEKSIHRKHVLIINATIEAQKIDSFEALAEYRHKHPECLIIASHPYYPGPICLKEDLEKHIRLFDAIEYSWYHSKFFNQPNRKAQKIAAKHQKAVLATSDNHILKYFDTTYSLVEAEKNIQSIFKAIRENKITIHSQNLPWWKLGTIISGMLLRTAVRLVTPR